VAKVLTAAAVKKIQPGARRIEVPDGGCRGLRLIVQPSGSKSWAVRLRRPDGRTSKVTLGAVDLSGGEADAEPTLGGLLTLAAARQLTVEVLRQKALGRDPASERIASKRRVRSAHAERTANAFAVLAKAFIVEHAQARTRTWRLSARLLGFTPDLELIPGGLAARWAARPVVDIGANDIADLVDEVKRKGVPGWKRRNGGDSVAWVFHARVGKFFSWLVERRVITANPCTAVRRPDASTPRERILTDLEVRLFWLAASEMNQPFGPLLRLLLLTGQRRQEVAAMVWAELSEGRETWSLPSERTKNSRAHTVPLSKAARDLIASINPIGTVYVFTSNGRTPVSGWSKVKARLDEKMLELARAEKATVRPFTIHDLRRTTAAGLQRLGVALPVTERILNHVSGSFAGVVGVYQRHEYADEKRDALQRWADHLAKITRASA
jgi:integrase